MAKLKKETPTLDQILFATPEQKVLRLLLSEPTTQFTLRVISSKLKGVRGLGGTEGLSGILSTLQDMGFVDFVNHQREVRLQDDNRVVQVLKTVLAICEIESL